MDLPAFIKDQPALELPFPEDVVESAAIRSDGALVVFFTFRKDMDLPPHAHGPQWGTVLDGELELTIGDQTRKLRRGDSYDIPAGVTHGARITAGTKVIDVFAEIDRYPLKPRG